MTGGSAGQGLCRPGPQELQEWSKQLVQTAQPDGHLPSESALDYMRMLPPQGAISDLYGGPTNLSRQRSWEHNRVCGMAEHECSHSLTSMKGIFSCMSAWCRAALQSHSILLPHLACA